MVPTLDGRLLSGTAENRPFSAEKRKKITPYGPTLKAMTQEFGGIHSCIKGFQAMRRSESQNADREMRTLRRTFARTRSRYAPVIENNFRNFKHPGPIRFLAPVCCMGFTRMAYLSSVPSFSADAFCTHALVALITSAQQ